MLSYETCKKLKDAGFPQHIGDLGSWGYYDFKPNEPYAFIKYFIIHVQAYELLAYCPSLEELLDEIEKVLPTHLAGECCPCSWYLHSTASYDPKHTKGKYEIYPSYGFPAEGGSTPAEAAAELWLKLKEKSAEG